VVQSGTFALVEWGLDEDPEGLDGIVEPPPENEPPYRPRERHPIPSKEMARSSGRGGEQRARRREEGEERRTRRFPPPAEVAYEILAGAEHPLTLVEIATQGAERALMPDAFVRDTAALSAALSEDNRRRESAGRKPLFALDGDSVSLAAQPEPGERVAVIPPAPRPAAAVDVRRAALLALRRRLRECDGATVENVAAQLLEKLGFHDLKVAKRGREHVVYTGRKKMGFGDVRHCVRIMRGAGEVSRREVTDLRRDIGNYGAQIGVVMAAGEPGRDARADAAAAGQLPVILLCGDALAEAMVEAVVGCRLVVVPEVDEAFFKAAAEAAAQDEAARKIRREDRDRREAEPREGRRARGEDRPRREKAVEAAPPPARNADATPYVEVASEIEEEPAPRRERPAAAQAASSVPVAVAAPVTIPAEEGEDDEGEGDEEDGPEGESAGAGSPEEGSASLTAEGGPRKRRRRRRRRGGRGRGERREGAAPPVAGSAAAAEGEARAADPSVAGTTPLPVESAPVVESAPETAQPPPPEEPREPREPEPLVPPPSTGDGGEPR
jgi:hypothetical protein